MKRCIGAAVVVAAFALQTTAWAEEIDSSIEFRPPTPPPGEVVGTHSVVVAAKAQSSIRSLNLEIYPDPSETSIPPLGESARKSMTYPPGQTNAVEIDMPWDSVRLTPYNGAYRIIASVDSQLGFPSSAIRQNLMVNNAPAKPQGVRVKLETGDVPFITWASNKEPDLIGYEVLRTADAKPPVRIATTGALSYRDIKAPRDVTLRYEVVAVRHSPVTPSSGIRTASSPTAPLIIASPEDAERPALPPPPAAIAPAPVIVKPIVGPRRDLGFEPLLPYAAPIPQRFKDPEIPDNPIEVLANPTRLVQGRVHAPSYMAAALLLLVLAFHLGRIARRLLSD